MTKKAALAIALVLACCRGRDDSASTIARDPSTASATPKPTPTTDAASDAIDATDAAADAAIVLPAIDTGCAVDADCATTFYALSGTYACCVWCGSTAGNAAWAKKVDAICTAARPTNCPPLACPSGPMHARCDAGKCIGKF